MQDMLKIALLSPNKSAYSETFIKAHKELLEGNIHYYYDGLLPNSLEKHGSLNKENLQQKLLYKFFSSFKSKFTFNEFLLYRSFKKNKIQVVFAEFGTVGSNVTKISKALNIPLIVHFHGYDAAHYATLIEYRDRYRAMFDYCSKVIAVSKVMISKLIENGCPAEKIKLNPYGPSNAFFNVIPNYESKNILAVGRFVDKKAPYYLIMAMQRILKIIPEAKLTIAGNGPLQETCKNLSTYLGLENNIYFPGIINPNQLLKLMENSRCFVQHSITSEDGDMEGTPVGILEACAGGLPVVSTRHAGIPDVVINGQNGFIVEEHDVQEMSNSLIKLLQDKKLSESMGRNAQLYVRENFNLQNHISIINAIINESVQN
jgi:colanic acid/amylovoran biosynthesis glycosyltransferase